jgi:NAD(P)-dependent dehydrogenase (short-subunit alcohol dehydrogenase family)
MRTLITGGNRGIGLELVRQMLARGDRVIATARQPGQAAELNRLASEFPGRLAVLAWEAERVGGAAELAREVARIDDHLDLVIANAGMMVRGERFGGVTEQDLAQTLAVNTIGPFMLAQALAPLLAKGSAPKLLLVSSVLGSLARRDAFYTPSYCISKAALNMAMRLLTAPLRELGITTIAVHPGWVRTAMGGEQAPLLPAESARDLLQLADGLRPEDAGRFLAHDGSELPF